MGRTVDYCHHWLCNADDKQIVGVCVKPVPDSAQFTAAQTHRFTEPWKYQLTHISGSSGWYVADLYSPYPSDQDGFDVEPAEVR